MRCSLLTLSCYLDGELEARQHGELEAHLVGCPRCRAGLSHLRDEVELIGGLAQVRVPEPSARAMLEVLGLIGPDEVLPQRTTRLPEAPAPEPPSRGTQLGGALPWAVPARVARPVSTPDDWAAASSAPLGPPSPDAALPAASPAAEQTALGAGGPAAAEELDFGATSIAGEDLAVGTAPAAAPGRTADEDAAREEADLAMVVEPLPAGGVAIGPPPFRGADAGLLRTTSAPPADSAATVAPRDTAATDAPADTAATDAPADTAATDAPADTAATPQPADRAATAGVPAATPPSEDVPSRYPCTAAPHPSVPRPQPPPSAAVPSLPGGTPVAVSLHDTPSATDPLGEEFGSTIADPGSPYASGDGGPQPAARPSLFERFREKVAMHRALSGDLAPELDDGVEVISGTGAPLRRGSARADLARRRSEALRPTMLEALPSPLRSEVAWEQLPPAAHPAAVPQMGAASLSGTPVDPFGARPRDGQAAATARTLFAAPPPPSASTVQRFTPGGAQQSGASGSLAPPLPPAPLPAETFEPPAPHGASLSELREGRRLLLLYVGAILVLFGVALSSARVIWPLAPNSPAASSTQTASTTAPLGLPPPASAPSAHASQPAAPSQAPAASQPAVPKTVGAGGTGWQIQDVRYGAHGPYFLVVFDLNGAGAAPTVSVVNLDAQTLVVTVAGTTGATTVAAPPTGQWVSGLARVSPSPTPGAAVYRITLSRPGHGSPGIVAATATAPMRIAITITA